MKLFSQECYIDGEWKGGKHSLPVFNPSTDEEIGKVPLMGEKETREAIDAAYNAFPSWKSLLPKERSLLLRKWFNLMVEYLDDLAKILTLEQGKPLAEAKGEIQYGANFIEWFAEEGKRFHGDVVPSPMKNVRSFVIKQPVGVVCAITPWNFPSAMIARKCAPALAAGCTFVVKPAELTPFSALAMAKLSKEAGIPPGVFNVITGDAAKIGQEMCTNQKVRKISFTGSTRVGKLLIAQSAPTVKRLSMELGGSAPLIVFEDADIPTAIKGLIQSKFRNSGQTCICADRIFIQESIYETFIKELISSVKQLKVGDGFESGIQIGPLINQAAVEKIEAQIKDAVSKGAKVELGGKRHPLGFTYFEPTVIRDVTTSMQIANEETFGPVAPLIRFKTEEEVIKMANSSNYGLASYFFTQDHNRMWRVAEALEDGMVSINGGLFSNEVIPFGGVKESGLGREGSKYGLDEYLEKKTICITTL